MTLEHRHERRRRPISADGLGLLHALEAATQWLAAHAAEVNSLNVFPVPDGDTGTNMLLTMRATIKAMRSHADRGAASMAQAMVHGALMGARGNSGVILSQILRGLARGLSHETFSGAELAVALRHASDTAYNAVSQPVEGTILTVIREAAEAAEQGGGDLVAVLERAVNAAKAAVAKTPTLLPVLREAGVVDAGGQGLYYLLDGALRHARGDSVEVSEQLYTADVSTIIERNRTEFAGHADGLDHDARYGYCTEFLVTGISLDVDMLRGRLSTLGDSMLVVGDPTLIRVHIHTSDPGRALSIALEQGGSLHQIKIDNMQEQHAAFVPDTPATAVAEAKPLAIGIVAVAAGEGLRQVLESLGVHVVVPGGQTMNPSTEDLLQAVNETGAQSVLILPNNKNIIGAAKQAAELASVPVAVIESQSLPQGVAAMLAFNPLVSLDDNRAAMEAALLGVRTGELTRAVRTTSVDGIPVVEGQVIGLVDGKLAVAGDELEPVLVDVLLRLGAETSEILTLYSGSGVSRDEADAIVRSLGDRFPNASIELIEGGQPHYEFIVSAE